MQRVSGRAALGAAVALVLTAASVVLSAQQQSEIYLLVMDQKGTPVLDIEPDDITIEEDAGTSTIVSVTRVGWPLKLTVLVDNGPGTADSLVHLRSSLTRLFEGIPRDIPVSLIATAPNPRWLAREEKDPVQIANAVGRLTPDESLGRFSDALLEYSQRLDLEFRDVGSERMQPYLPVLVSIATSNMDGSNVIRENVEKMLRSLNKHRVWTHMIMVSANRSANEPGEITSSGVDEGQNAEIGKLVEEVTRGRYIPISGSGTSALASTILPSVAEQVAFRYIKQMFQYRIVMERPAGASGPMKNFSLKVANHPGTIIMLSTDGNMP